MYVVGFEAEVHAIVLVVILEKIVSHGTSHANRRHVKTVEPVDQQIANPTSATVLLSSYPH
uniref:Uncharacterized protein n=1 Tax=Megaselia scalaris TaxID=36166 RepID=T1GDS2_MEGSC